MENIGPPIILLVFSNTSAEKLDEAVQENYLDYLQEEQSKIELALKGENWRGENEKPICEYISLSREKANLDEIIDVFANKKNKNRIVGFHFAGHADSYQLLLQDAEKKGSKIAHAGGLIAFFRQQQANLKFIFLNGCKTLRQAKEIYDGGIPTVIGTKRRIDDRLAKIFAVRFYRSLLMGVSMEHAWGQALAKIQSEMDERSKVWISSSRRGLATGDDDETAWEIHTRSFEWNLGSEAENPLFGLPIPDAKLPEDPFISLKRYEAEHTRIFFGRGKEIRDLFSLLITQKNAPLILLHGQSGVGKSSVLEAGLIPRLEAGLKPRLEEAGQAEIKNRIEIGRRDPKEGLLMALKKAMVRILPAYPSPDPDSKKEWEKLKIKALKVEKLINELEQLVVGLDQQVDQTLDRDPDDLQNPFVEKIPSFVIILDQAEESFTQPVKGMTPDDEWKALLEALRQIQLNPRFLHHIKVILSFRKEYLPEIKAYCEKHDLNWEDVYLKRLDKKGIREVVEGIPSDSELRNHYGFKKQTKPNKGEKHTLASAIAEDLMEDKHSSISPILQIYLTEMWEKEKESNKSRKREFKLDDYKKIKLKLDGKLETFFHAQLKELEEAEEAKKSSLCPFIKAGLVLDILNYHTTEMSTAKNRTRQELYENYIDDELAEAEKDNKKQQPWIDQEEGEVLPNEWNEREALRDEVYSKKRKKERISKDELEDLLATLIKSNLLLDRVDGDSTRLTHDTLAPIARNAFKTSLLPGPQATRVLKNKGHLFKEDKEVPKVSQADANPETKRTATSSTKPAQNENKSKDIASGDPKSTDKEKEKKEHLNGRKGIVNQLKRSPSALVQWIAGDQSDHADEKLISLGLIEKGKIGMRKWEPEEQALVRYNEAQQKKKLKGRQRARMLGIFSLIAVGVIAFLGLMSISRSKVKDKQFVAYQALSDQADLQLAKANRNKEWAVLDQDYQLADFPRPDALFLESLVTMKEEISLMPRLLLGVDTIQLPFSEVDLSTDGRYAISWEDKGTKAQITSLGPGQDQWENLLPQEKDTLRAITFSPDGNYLGMALKSGAQQGVLLIQEMETGCISLDTFPAHDIISMDFARDTSLLALGTADKTLLIWDQLKQKMNTSLVHSQGSRVESVQWSHDLKKIWTKIKSPHYTYLNDDCLWRYDERWEQIWMKIKYLQSFYPKKELFINDDDDKVSLIDGSGSEPEDLREIQIPKHDISFCQFNAAGNIIAVTDNLAWVLSQKEVPLDLFEFNHDVELIKENSEDNTLLFLTKNGEIYAAPEGKSPLRWMEGQKPGGQHVTNILSDYYKKLDKYSFWINLLGILALLNFLLHIPLFLVFSPKWLNQLFNWFGSLKLPKLPKWVNKTIEIVMTPVVWVLAIFLIIICVVLLYNLFIFVINFIFSPGEYLQSSFSNLIICVGLTLIFNLHQIFYNFTRGHYKIFRIWLFLFLIWIVVLGWLFYNLPVVFLEESFLAKLFQFL